ncbi:hypothetical protein [Tepidibacter hydrothermalis]|uniref:Uncharacterized protein n=1 Tax=Tepidibacter hydrothermalis TaxID=3036126 RepID=A0ABY8EA25_9FIRM|nr:hypothetical protein [Tepidibacter hydrothermalis]WFD09786.1 hypothetical protein P4S50_15515 [Tepidibacter hydrothermalis]
MNPTAQFQKDIEIKLSKYLAKKMEQFRTCSQRRYDEIKFDYIYQLSIIRSNPQYAHIQYDDHCTFNELLITCMSEPKTQYNLNDYSDLLDASQSIYSPRIDLAISPAIKKKRSKKVSLGNYKLSEDVKIYKLLHEIDFIKEIELAMRRESYINFRNHHLDTTFYINDATIPRETYINGRPLHLFGIEIENQTNPKHLMGDFMNALSLSKIPIVVVPSEKLDNCMKMLIYVSTINNLKEVPLYSLLEKVIVLTFDQFISILNNIISRDIGETINSYGLR